MEEEEEEDAPINILLPHPDASSHERATVPRLRTVLAAFTFGGAECSL